MATGAGAAPNPSHGRSVAGELCWPPALDLVIWEGPASASGASGCGSWWWDSPDFA